jgi:hypothetical protein
MNPYQLFRLARLLLLMLLATVFLSLARGRPVSRRLRLFVLALLVVAALGSVNFGLFHPGWGHVHYWDAFHYFMGAKYLPELGYSRLYEATYTAGRELGAFDYVTHLRDLETYALRDATSVDRSAVRSRFRPERWEAFKRDLAYWGPHINEWRGLLQDHGYNDPPPRALLLHLLTRAVPANAVTVTALSSLDYLLVAAAFVAVRWGFGELPAALSGAFFFLSWLARFDFIGGSILRWDWIAALLAGLSLFARGRNTAAGALLGYAVLARIFPVLFLVPLGVKWLQGRFSGVRDPALSRALAAVAAVLVLAAMGVAAMGDERVHLREYEVKIQRHSEAAFANSVGLRPLIAMHTAPWSQGPDGRVYVAHGALLAARPSGAVTALAAALYLLAALPLILRARHLESVMYAVPLVFCALSLSGYYYSFLVLLVLLPWRDGRADPLRLVEMALLTAIMAVGYGFELVPNEPFPLFHAASMQLALFFLLWLGFEYARRLWPKPLDLPARQTTAVR